MIINKIDSYYFINSVKEHSEFKKELLYLIEVMPSTLVSMSTPVEYEKEELLEDRYLSDWSIDSNYHRKYLDFFYDKIQPYLNNLCLKLSFKRYKIINGWFQKYKNNHQHIWHVHPDSNYTNVFYLDLPDEEISTELYDPISNQIIKPKVKEGDLLTFPANMLHRSPKNLTDKTKTIISFNTSFEVYKN
tara:strand:+ start:1049 stop:1615 length:567 start_codon:yes stop_codon:yes gene_type:complete